MAGRLGAADVSPGVETALYAPGAGVTATIVIFVANRTPAPAKLRVVHRPGAAATVGADYLTFDESIDGNDSRKSRYFEVENPQEILVQSNVSGVTFQANGVERT